MKKYSLLLILFSLSSIVFSQTQLSFQLSNPHVIYGTPDVFQFDVNLKANEVGSFHRDLQIYLDYNPEAFGIDAVLGSKVTVTGLGLMDMHYNIVNVADNTQSKIAIICDAFEELNQIGSTSYFNEVQTNYQGLLRIQIEIEDADARTGINFDEVLMNGGQYMQSLSSPNPVAYADINVYDNALLDIPMIGQDVEFTQGWQGISSFMLPSEANIEPLFEPVLDGLTIMQNFEGVFVPSQDINTLVNWNANSGYVVKMTAASQLKVLGTNIEGGSIQLNEGWNLIPVLSGCDVVSSELFGDVLSSVQVVQEVAGVGLFWPSMEINTLQVLLPGKAYYIKMSSAETITFPDCE